MVLKNPCRIQSCYCSSLSLGRCDQAKCIQSSQAKTLEILYCIVTLFHQQEPSHELLPTCSCSSPALFFLPITSYRATAPPCFMPRHNPCKGLKRPGSGGHSSFHEAVGFASVFQLHQCAGFVPRLVPKHMCALLCCMLWETNSEQQQRTGFSEPQSWTSLLITQYPQIFSQRRTSSGAVWSRSLLEVFLQLQLQTFGSTEEIN